MNDLLARVERAELEPWDVSLATLPSRAGANVHAVADDLRLCFGTLAAEGSTAPLMYGSRWAGQRLGMDREIVSRALRSLVRADVIRHVGSLDARGRGSEGPRLYELGEGAEVRPPVLPVGASGIEGEERREQVPAGRRLQAPIEPARELVQQAGVRGAVGRRPALGLDRLGATVGGAHADVGFGIGHATHDAARSRAVQDGDDRPDEYELVELFMAAFDATEEQCE
jgi:hypothetical protein